jgi:hypothetical protein
MKYQKAGQPKGILSVSLLMGIVSQKKRVEIKKNKKEEKEKKKCIKKMK